MNNLLLLALLVSINIQFSFGQHSTIITETDTVEVKIQATSATGLYTTGGNMNYDKMTNIVFHGKPSESLLIKLKDNNISYEFEDKSEQELVSFTDSKKIELPPGDKQIYLSLGKFNKSRRTGKWMQVFGMMASGAAIALGEYELALAGTGLSFVGFVVDISASNHLEVFEKGI